MQHPIQIRLTIVVVAAVVAFWFVDDGTGQDVPPSVVPPARSFAKPKAVPPQPAGDGTTYRQPGARPIAMSDLEPPPSPVQLPYGQRVMLIMDRGTVTGVLRHGIDRWLVVEGTEDAKSWVNADHVRQIQIVDNSEISN